jgi:hypothetical protein
MVVDATNTYGREFMAADRWYWPPDELDATMAECGWQPDDFPHCYMGKVQVSRWVQYKTYEHESASRWDIEEELWEYPPKVLLAKLRRLVARGLLDGCACGCRGDFEITDRGKEILARVLIGEGKREVHQPAQ